MLKGKHILLGITGSIAAYKAAVLIRFLRKEGAEVKVIMTTMAKEFISPLTVATLSANPILVDFYNPENGDWNSHISLGMWADLYIIAPASANTIAKMATGVADNLLLTTYLSSRAPVAIAPAMDVDMFNHVATRRNLEILSERGVYIIEPASGELASGLEGKGRMEEPEKILFHIESIFSVKGPLKGKRILLTAGATRERIDPVRFITNDSSGKMGYALTKELVLRGADVTVICGATAVDFDIPGIRFISAESAESMYNAAMTSYASDNFDVVILCAAVSDYTPVTENTSKKKRGEGNYTIELKPTKDIAAALGSVKKKGVIHVGFALETDNEIENAKDKLKRKSLNLIVLNSLNDKGAGFGVDTNKISVIDREGGVVGYSLKSKREVAADIIDNIERLSKCSQG